MVIYFRHKNFMFEKISNGGNLCAVARRKIVECRLCFLTLKKIIRNLSALTVDDIDGA